jgi:hypothetical protein
MLFFFPSADDETSSEEDPVLLFVTVTDVIGLKAVTG